MSDLTFPHVFWNKNFEPDSYNHSNNPFRIRSALKTQRTHERTTIFSLSFEVQLRLRRLYTYIHQQPKPNLCWQALLSKHHRGTVDSRAQASPFFFSPFTNLRRAGLSEEQCLCVIVLFHLSSHLIFRSRIHNG